MAEGMLDTVFDKNATTKRKKVERIDGDGPQAPSNVATVSGYDQGEVISALQKAIRRGQEERALYWAAELVGSQLAFRMWRRLVVIAAEDVGLADPDMMTRIWTLKQAHEFGRELNIVFLAVMLLCRAPKNREADDASYLYEEKRKAGNWKIQMPPEAVDGHTRQGRQQLYRMADQNGTTWQDMWNREFYFDVALLKNYVEIDGDPFRHRLMEMLGLPYRTYDIETCSEPRVRSGGQAQKDTLDELTKRQPTEMVVKEGWFDPETGDRLDEPVPDRFMVQSFTDPELWYQLDLIEQTCACPAFQRGGGAICKHLHGLMMKRQKGEV